ncbi:chemotaxis protein CheB [Lentzea albida]|uniref:histidine kinase n=1 Tax=Lentzea albida TaxID=65499 RepID=A0A1H9WEX0_9PSEU|nr:chemotaxis protein CheB [Lentzea albida]SES32374.1 Signal transduction histidine kinase [Lentzea albida]
MDAHSARYQVVLVGASLGGAEALQVLLGGLRTDLPAPVVVVQHLGPGTSALDSVLGKVSRHPVVWAHDGVLLEPGTVYLCPGRTGVRLEPDGTLTVQPMANRSSYGQVDELFTSASTSMGAHVLALVLTGLGNDGSAGALAVHRAGGTVIVQDEFTSTAFGMPSAVIKAGAADLVLPLGELPDLLDRVVGAGRPVPTPAVRATEAMFAGGGELGRLMSTTDWGTTAFGPVDRWPALLRDTVAMVLANPVPMSLMWGHDLLQLYNDAYRDLLGERHPEALGRSVLRVWPDAATTIAPVVRQVVDTGTARRLTDQPFVVNRDGRPEELFATIAYSPVRDGDRVAGVLATLVDTTDQVRNARRLTTLHRLTATSREASDTTTDREVCQWLMRALAANPQDVPFALVYLVEERGVRAHLAASTGLTDDSPALDQLVTSERPAAWPLHKSMRTAEPQVVEDLLTRFPGLVSGTWPQPPHTAVILPVSPIRDGVPAALLVLGVSSHAPFDAAHRQFFDLIAERVAATLTAARIDREQKRQMAALAELNRAKNLFFAGLSHEFRTPLTLLLLPLEEQLTTLPAEHRDTARIAHRNALRLLRMVNTLLAFSELEQGRDPRVVEDIEDLAGLTTDLAGVLRPAIERANLALVVDCPPLDRPVRLDRAMWETVVLSLLSNALKHTFTGSITIALGSRQHHVELVVTDTGTGIDPAEIPHLFTRFHRIEGARARSREGSGIGLALVRQLVSLHHGSIRVRSEPDLGSTFTVWIPYAQPQHAQRPAPVRSAEEKARMRQAFAEEAESWLVGDEPAVLPSAAGHRATVLVVDDNADMRNYLRRMLSDQYDVLTAAGGDQALDRLAGRGADLIIGDVVVPDLDGVRLVERVRADPSLRATPIILLTALGTSS